MAKITSSLFDLVKGIRAFKELANEVKDVYPEISSFLGLLNSKKNIDAEDIKNAISFAVNKIMNDPYIVVGVKKDDPQELIDAVYKVKAKFYHPDNKNTGNADKFMKIKDAYDKIKNNGE